MHLPRLVSPDRGTHDGGAFFHYHRPDDVICGFVVLVRCQETINKDSCRRFIPGVAGCPRQMNAKGIGCATFLGLRIKVVNVFSSDGILERLVGGHKLFGKVSPDFTLRIYQ